MDRNVYRTYLWPIFIFFVFLLLQTVALAGEKTKCPICGMNFEVGAKTSYESTRDGKPVAFCSFSCARRFHQKYPDAKLHAHDFETGKPVEASSAFFLAKSKNVLKELPFDMPPSVVAFAGREAANKTKARLGDGEVVKGFPALLKIYE